MESLLFSARKVPDDTFDLRGCHGNLQPTHRPAWLSCASDHMQPLYYYYYVSRQTLSPKTRTKQLLQLKRACRVTCKGQVSRGHN